MLVLLKSFANVANSRKLLNKKTENEQLRVALPRNQPSIHRARKRHCICLHPPLATDLTPRQPALSAGSWRVALCPGIRSQAHCGVPYEVLCKIKTKNLTNKKSTTDQQGTADERG